MQAPLDDSPHSSTLNRRVLTSAVVLLGLFCLLTSMLLAGGAYLFLRPGGLLDQSGMEDDLREQVVPPASLSGWLGGEGRASDWQLELPRL